jgi:DNA-directed RNA polymerase subunit M/transcription elongation factor TFIIS
MDNKIKTFYPDKAMRELAEKLGIDKKTPEEIGQYIQETMDDPETRKHLISMFDLIKKGDTQDLGEEWKKDLEEMEKLEKKLVGIQERKGKFICVNCMIDEGRESYYEDEAVTLSDIGELKPTSFYQCHNCKKKFSKEGITE